MSCSQFNPNLPHSTTLEQAAWIVAFANKMEDACGKTECDSVCTDPKTEDEIKACGQCLADPISGILSCDKIPDSCKTCMENSIGTGDFQSIFACAETPGSGDSLSTGAIAGIVVGSVIGLVFIIMFVRHFYRKKKSKPSKSSKSRSKYSYGYDGFSMGVYDDGDAPSSGGYNVYDPATQDIYG